MGTTELSGIPRDGDLKPVIEAAQSALELETARADRLDSKARGQIRALERARLGSEH